MKFLLLSISALCLGLQQCFGHSLSKIELVYPKDLNYKVEEEQNGTVLTITAPESEKPTLREIIYYHLVEKPFGSAESDDDDDSESDIPEFDTTGRVFTNAQQGPQFIPIDAVHVLDGPISINSEHTPNKPITKEIYYGEGKIDKRKEAVDLIEKDKLEDTKANEDELKIETEPSIKEITEEETANQKRLKRALSSETKISKNDLFKKFYDKASSEDHSQDINKPSSGLRGTYGMVLNDGGGVVWNALKNAGFSFDVGSDSDESGSDSNGHTSDESSSSDSSSESNESKDNHSEETYLSEDINNSDSNESQSSNRSEENHNSEGFNESNGVENAGYSQENVDNGFYVDINNGLNNANNIGEETSGLNNGETDQTHLDNNNFKINSILQDLDDMLDNNPSINSHTNHALDIVHDVLEDKNDVPGVIVQKHPNKPILNILEGIFTNIIQNNFTINNAGGNKPDIIGNKDEVKTDKETTKPELDKAEIENTTPIIHIDKQKEVNTEAPEINPTKEQEDINSIEDNKLTTTDTTISITTETTSIDAEKDVPNEHKSNLDNKVNVTLQESKTNEPSSKGQAKKHQIGSETDNNIDFMLEFLNNEKFWKFVGDLVGKHIEMTMQNTESLIKREVKHQVRSYLRKHKNKPYITHNKDEISINKENNITNNDNNDTTTNIKESIHDHRLSNNNSYTHTENSKATNIYNFFGHNPDKIINSIKPILNKDGGINIFNFGPDSDHQETNLNKNKDTIDKKGNTTDLPDENKPNEANINPENTTEQSLNDIIPTTEKIASHTTQKPVTNQPSKSESSEDMEHTTPIVKDTTEINHTKSTESDHITTTTESHINKASTEKDTSTTELPTEVTTKVGQSTTTEITTNKSTTELSTSSSTTTTVSSTESHEFTTEASIESTKKSNESKTTEMTTETTKVTTEEKGTTEKAINTTEINKSTTEANSTTKEESTETTTKSNE